MINSPRGAHNLFVGLRWADRVKIGVALSLDDALNRIAPARTTRSPLVIDRQL